MKKILIVTLSLLASISSYAYNYYSEKDDYSTLYIFVILIAGVLNVILLYKIWCMTNDVKKLREKFCFVSNFVKFKVRQLYLIGDIETAYNTLNTYIVDEVEKYTKVHWFYRSLLKKKRNSPMV